MTWGFSEPIISKLRKGIVGDEFIPVTEQHIVYNGKILLTELPDSFQKIQIDNYIEVNDINTPLLSNQFITDYNSGVISFNISENNKNLTCNYFGRGCQYFPVSRVWTKIEENNVTENLKEFIDQGQIAIEAMEEVGDLPAVIDEAIILKANLELDISTGNNLHTTLQSDISNANTKQTDLETTIFTANTIKINLDSSISIGELTKTNLDESILIGNTLKTDLDTSITNSQTAKTNLDTSIINSETAKTNLDGSIILSESKKSDLDGSITLATTTKINLDLSIVDSETAKTDLDNSITIANQTKINLDNSITQGDLLKINLDNDISIGNILHDNLQSDITNGTQLKLDLDSNISDGNDLHTTLNTDISNANTMIENLQNVNTYQIKTATEDLLAGDFVNIYNNSGTISIRKANATDSTKPAHGFILENVSSGCDIAVYFEGINDKFTGLTVGVKYYLDTVAGQITSTTPSTSNNILQYLGDAINSTSIYFTKRDYILLI